VNAGDFGRFDCARRSQSKGCVSCAGILLCLWIAPELAESATPLPVVVYVHGYRTELLDAMREHRLEEQFATSGVAAAFVVAAGPSSPSEAVVWRELEPLLARAEAHGGRALSREQVVVLGHSGAYRTLRSWMSSPAIETLILLDAMYGDPSAFRRFVEERAQVQLVLVSRSTRPAAERFLARLDRRARSRVVHRRANASHMEIVTAGEIIPEVLRSLATPSNSG
jgi:hypothetical protein